VRHRRRLLVALAMLVVGTSDVLAQIKCVPVSGVSGVTPCLVSGTYVIPVECPNNQTCGSGANSSVLGLTPFNGTTGWHNYSSGSAATYLNNLSTSIGAGVTFAMSGVSALRSGNGTLSNLPWLNPTNDNGYYLAASTSTSTITMTFGVDDGTGTNTCTGCISQFSLYWGSLDGFNKISFTPWGGNAITLNGVQIAAALGLGARLSVPGQYDPYSYVLNFEVPTSDTLWSAVTISSSYPAFEFDNIAWETVIGNSNGAPIPIPSGTTPEPSGLLLFTTAMVSVVRIMFRLPNSDR
jgi:hypothetical protein